MFNQITSRSGASMLATLFDKKMLAGVFIGISLVAAGYAVSQSGGYGNTLSNSQSTLLSQQSSVLAAEVEREAQECATGTVDGTVGKSIGDALAIHTRIASASPNTEVLFSASSNCFSQLTQIFDLSFSIPSLASIISAAQNAVMAYAQKKICTAVAQVTGLVTSPINDAIGDINRSVGGFRDLNGLTNGLITRGVNSTLGQIDGSDGGSYTVNANPFNASQTSFDQGPAVPPSTGGSAGNINNSGVIANLNQAIANTENQLASVQAQLAQFEQALNVCKSSQGECSDIVRQIENQKATINTVADHLEYLNTQARTLATGGVQSAPVTTNAPAPVAPVKSDAGWFSSITGLFK